MHRRALPPRARVQRCPTRRRDRCAGRRQRCRRTLSTPTRKGSRMRRGRLEATLLMVFTALGTALGAARAGAQGATGAVTGRVTDAAAGTPILGANVRVVG